MIQRCGLLLLLLRVFHALPVLGEESLAGDVAQFEITGRLMAVESEPAEERRTFRSVALRMPWAYVLDRDGGLSIFRILDDAERAEQLVARQLIKEWLAKLFDVPRQTNGSRRAKDDALVFRPEFVMDNVGDGKDLKMFQDVLICTRKGCLEVYSLAKPDQPQHLGRFGPENVQLKSRSIVRHDHLVFVIGVDHILCYDLSVPQEPKLVSEQKNERHSCTGCVVGGFLCVGESATRKSNREGIAVYDVSNLQQLKEVGFVPTVQSPYHLFALPDDRLVAALDSDSRIHSVATGQVYGNSAILKLTRSGDPTLLGEIGKSGGRTAAVISHQEASFFVCNGVIFRVEEHDLQPCFSFYPYGSTLDSFSYHGDSDGLFAAFAADREVTVVRLRPSD